MSGFGRAALLDFIATSASQIFTQTSEPATKGSATSQKVATATTSNGSIRIVCSCENAEGDSDSNAELQYAVFI